MITQNFRGQIVLPPIYPENIASGQLILRAQTAPSTNFWAKAGKLNISAGTISLILLGLLVLTTVLFFWNSLRRYKKIPEQSFALAIKKDPKLKPLINQK